MPTPDRFPGTRLEDEIKMETNPAPDGGPGSLSFDGTDFVLEDAAGTFNPRTGGTGLTEGQHQGLDTQVHMIAEDCETVITRTSGLVTNVTTWNVGQTVKIREVSVTRDGNGIPTATTTVQYDGAGTAVSTYTRTITRASGLPTQIDGALS